MAHSVSVKWLRIATVVVGSLLLVGAFSSSAKADTSNKLTKFTFSGPVQIPGFHGPMVLHSGTYVFRLLDTHSNRNVVQIFNEDQTHLYATILAIPNYRLRPTGESVIHFAERPAGSAPAIKAWFYPGDTTGLEFVYPKSEAVMLAKAVNEPVLSMPEEEASNITEPVKSADEPAVKALEQAPVMAEEPSGKEVEMSEVVEAGPTHSEEMASNTLPQTASDMPLAALGGILLVGIGLGLRLLSRKLA